MAFRPPAVRFPLRKTGLKRGLCALVVLVLAVGSVFAQSPQQQKSPKEMARLMLEDARHWAEHGLFEQARSLARRAQNMNLSWDGETNTPQFVLSQIEAMELGLPIPQPVSQAEEAENNANSNARILPEQPLREAPSSHQPLLYNALRDQQAPVNPVDQATYSHSMAMQPAVIGSAQRQSPQPTYQQAPQLALLPPAEPPPVPAPMQMVQPATHREIINVPAPQVHFTSPAQQATTNSQDSALSGTLITMVSFASGLLVCLVAFGFGFPLLLRRMGPLMRIEVVYPAAPGYAPQPTHFPVETPPQPAGVRGNLADVSPAGPQAPLFPPQLLAERKKDKKQEKQDLEAAMLQHIFEENRKLQEEISRLPEQF